MRLSLLALGALALTARTNAQGVGAPTADGPLAVVEVPSLRSGAGASDTLRLNLRADFDPARSTLHLVGRTVVEPLIGGGRPTRSILRVYLNAPTPAIPDGLRDRVGRCEGDVVGFYGVNMGSQDDGAFEIVVPVPPGRLGEVLGCLAVIGTTNVGSDAVGALAYVVPR